MTYRIKHATLPVQVDVPTEADAHEVMALILAQRPELRESIQLIEIV